MSLKDVALKLALAPKLSSGQKLIKGLGLSKFKHAVIQKIINMSIPVYVITIDSRMPEREITQSRLKKLEATTVFKAKKFSDVIEPKKIAYTPPLELKIFTGSIPTDTLLIQRDLAGEYFNNPNMFESSECIIIDDKKINLLCE